MPIRSRWMAGLVTVAFGGALALAVPSAVGAAPAKGGGGSTTTTTTTSGKAGSPSALAKLVIKPASLGHVQVEAAGTNAFQPGTDGEALHVGDTIQTDSVGLAEIDYAANTYTRLDVNTTFTIKKLTDNQGNRQVQGDLTSGQTWNRTVALTQSESFQQSGGGATAAVAGTAFAVSCASPTQCTFTSVVDNVILTGNNGQTETLNPLAQCVATNGGLCAAPSQLTCDQLALIQWITQNVLLDSTEHGLGNGIFQPFAVTCPASAAPAYPPSAPVIVVQPAAAPSTGKLPFTGSSSTLPFAEAGIGLVLVGAVLAVGMRRRRSAHTLKV
jgi:FecR protein